MIRNKKMQLKKTTRKQTQRQSVETHLGMPIAEWRQKKRQEWAKVLSALSQFEFGAAYTPSGDDLFVVRRSADRVKDALDQEWVCW